MSTKFNNATKCSKNQVNESATWAKSFKLPNPSLENYFGLNERGSSADIRTPFGVGMYGKNYDRNLCLEDWAKTLIKVKSTWPTLYDYEEDMKSKVGPMSIRKPLKDRMDDIEAYYSLISKESKPISRSAIAAVRNEWNTKHGLYPRSPKRTLDLMKKSTSSGSPYFRKRKAVIDDSFPCRVYPVDDDVRQELSNSNWLAPAVLGWRGQEGGPKPDDVKQRVVWMFPFSVNIHELTVYQPLIEYAQARNIVPAWVSMDSVDAEITKLFDSKHPDDLVICTDFSKFDQHFNKVMQDGAREILSLLFHQSLQGWLDYVFPIKYMIPLAYDYGKIRYGQHGMASGSGGTNADETLTHRALQYEVAQQHNAQLNPHSQCLGDDGILTYPGITVDDVVESYSSHGQECNPDKQYASKTDCVYLRRWHHQNYRIGGVCVGVYSTYRALGRLMCQERYYDPDIWSKEMVTLRYLSIIENVKYHPLRDEFIEFCIKRDKYRLGLDIPGFLSNIERIAEEAVDEMPDFLGYTKSLQKDGQGTGIGSWWCVQYLKNRKSKA